MTVLRVKIREIPLILAKRLRSNEKREMEKQFVRENSYNSFVS